LQWCKIEKVNFLEKLAQPGGKNSRPFFHTDLASMA
jgi:hypothetical protein